MSRRGCRRGFGEACTLNLRISGWTRERGLPLILTRPLPFLQWATAVAGGCVRIGSSVTILEESGKPGLGRLHTSLLLAEALYHLRGRHDD